MKYQIFTSSPYPACTSSLTDRRLDQHRPAPPQSLGQLIYQELEILLKHLDNLMKQIIIISL